MLTHIFDTLTADIADDEAKKRVTVGRSANPAHGVCTDLDTCRHISMHVEWETQGRGSELFGPNDARKKPCVHVDGC